MPSGKREPERKKRKEEGMRNEVYYHTESDQETVTKRPRASVETNFKVGRHHHKEVVPYRVGNLRKRGKGGKKATRSWDA